MVSISYAITACNEAVELKVLLDKILRDKREVDEIVVLLDEPNSTPEIKELLSHKKYSKIHCIEGEFKRDFAFWKNTLNKFCTKDYIFNIDADEYPSEILIKYLPQLLEENPNIRVYALPRINTVHGLTQAHINKWRWNVDDKGRVNYPDYQIRIYKRDPDIFWEGKVHETLNIRNEAVPLPYDTEDWVLYHPKVIERQEKQNALYDTL